MQNEPNKVMEAALKYHRLGWVVVPIPHKEKRPVISWKEYQTRFPTEEELKAWFYHSPHSNIGIVTGKLSKIAVVDADGQEGIKTLITKGWGSVLESFSGSGMHLFYAYPEGADVRNTCKDIPGIDTRAEGGLVVVAPSIHPTGRPYEWRNQGFGKPLPPLPEVFLRQVEEIKANDEGWVAEALENLAPGNRHNTLVRVIGKLVHDRWDKASIMAFLAPTLERFNEEGAEKDAFTVAESMVDSLAAKDAAKPVSTVKRAPVGASIGALTFKTFESHEEEYRRRKLGAVGQPVGYAALDSLTGGLVKEELFVVAARTGIGKTNFLTRMAKNLCRQGLKTLFFSTEMSFERIWDRYQQYDATPGEYKQDAFIVCDDLVSRVGQVTDALAQVKPDVFIFDHVNHVGEDNELLSAFMHEFKAAAKKHRSYGIVAAQLNRAADFLGPDGKPVAPRLSMIKGSGTIEQVAAQVLILTETARGPEQNEILGGLDKNRYGEKGVIRFVLKKNPYKFEEAEG